MRRLAAGATGAAAKAPPAPDPDTTDKAPDLPQAPEPASRPAVAAQKAAGKGNGTAAGDAGSAEAGTTSKAETDAAASRWEAAIRARVERRKSYPAAAEGATGRVILRLSVAANGQLTQVGVVRSSGNAALDAAAVNAVQSAGRFPKAPAGLGETSFTLPISFAP